MGHEKGALAKFSELCEIHHLNLQMKRVLFIYEDRKCVIRCEELERAWLADRQKVLGLLDADAVHPYKGEEEHVSESPLANLNIWVNMKGLQFLFGSSTG